MSRPICNPLDNLLLRSLPEYELQLLLTDLNAVVHPVDTVLYDSGGSVELVYFPIDAVASALTLTGNGDAIEVATIGKEGCVGSMAALAETSVHKTIIQIGGRSLCMSAAAFRSTVERSHAIRRLVYKYNSAVVLQISQCVACNGLHNVEQRCCRWILMTRDRIDSNVIPLTHEYLGYMLGVRRASVSEVLASLQSAGLLSSRRDRIELLKPDEVQARACECYGIIRDWYTQLLSLYIRS